MASPQTLAVVAGMSKDAIFFDRLVENF